RKGSKLHSKKQFHLAERLRDTLINEAMEIRQQCQSMQIPFEPTWKSDFIPEILEMYSNLKEKELRSLIHRYIVTHNKFYYRELFRVMKAAVASKERMEKSRQH
ncbi:MAG TPA: DUF615 domain-containing protein, partial [Desulfocapsa sulfexigens]|nr:DUF615 domain-containing protein [Desulfocapsa sulfexigens]